MSIKESHEKTDKASCPIPDAKSSDNLDLDPITLDEVVAVLDLTIKHDYENKLICLLGMLSAYTENASFNIIFNSPSSTGKSFIPIEIARLFPEEDVLEVAYVSPTAFFHDHGEHDKETNNYIVNLERKIIVFLDQPHAELLVRLRSLLSHDKKEMKAHITDKQQSSGNRTKHIVLRGFPAVIFCSANTRIDEQEATRFFLLSPESSQEKIRDAIQSKSKRDADMYSYLDWIDSNPMRLSLRDRIRAIRDARIKDVIIPNAEEIANRFLNNKPILKPKHQRDIGRVMSLIKAISLLNFQHRESNNGVLTASEKDVEDALRLWEKLTPTQEYNISPYIYDIYRHVILPAYKELTPEIPGLTRKRIRSKHYEVYRRPISDAVLRQQVLPMLDAAGLIHEELHPTDRRVMVVVPSMNSEEGEGGGEST